MRLFGEVDGRISNRDAAEWLWPPFDADLRAIDYPAGKSVAGVGVASKTVEGVGVASKTVEGVGVAGKSVSVPTSNLD